ncbi:ABC transporter ATP-binding protein [Bifidobacterium sp. DSM 109958]|uniref:ABC transporter ATP-binding protein n=1 Tax=Bifidobacterium moraviense TaxID=2675323 RepID=A0A7Y0HZB8_9BIFI|nr:ATP-binding cassette domain-containing protein [Bifidobacterium sp. DSM 109958]NMN00624.1 ABC transporter ATP-binding protein [Bifidobacterium sp. DSM 109958]
MTDERDQHEQPEPTEKTEQTMSDDQNTDQHDDDQTNADQTNAETTDQTTADADDNAETDTETKDAATPMPIDIVYDDEEDAPADAADAGHRPALDQTDALIASFLGTDAPKDAAGAKPVSAEKPAEAAPVIMASRIDREITDADSTVFATYPTLAFKRVEVAAKQGGSPFPEPLDLAFYDRRVYVVTVSSEAQRMALMGLLTGMTRPAGGHVMFKSKDMQELTGTEYRSHYVGLMLQRNTLRADLSAIDNVTNAMEASGRNFLKPKHIIAEELLQRVGLPSELHETRVAKLPEIHRRRVALAKALCCEPAAVIADDPVAGVDEPVRGQLLGVLKQVARKENKTVVIVTTDASLASVADKTYAL